MPPFHSSHSAPRAVTDQLDQQARRACFELIPAKYVKLAAVDTFAEFIKVQQPQKGSAAISYGVVGQEVKISASYDFGDMLLPGILSLTVGGDVSARLSKVSLFILHQHMPRVAYESLYTQSPPPQQVVRRDEVVRWRTEQPTVFLLMSGYSAKATVTLAVEASVGYGYEPPEPVNYAAELTNTELPLSLSLGANASAAYTFDFMRARDRSPAYYCCSQDAQLRNDFERLSILIGQDKLKQDVRDWLAGVDGIYNINDKVGQLLKSGNPSATALANDYITVQYNKYNVPSRKENFIKVAKGICTQISDRSKFDPSRLVMAAYDKGQKLAAATHSADDYIARLDQIGRLLPDSAYILGYGTLNRLNPSIIENIAQATRLIRIQANRYQQQLALYKQQPATGAVDLSQLKAGGISWPIGSPISYLSYLKIASHSGEVGAGMAAGVGPLTAGAGISGSIKRSSYRYQSAAVNSNGVIVHTQDVVISYRQATVAVSAEAKIPFVSVGRGKEKAIGPYRVNGIFYKSSSVYWKYPDYPVSKSTSPAPNVAGLAGTGYCLGMSILTKDIALLVEGNTKRYIGMLPDRTKKALRLKNILLKYFQVAEETLRLFLNGLAAQTNFDRGISSYIIEAAYSNPNPTGWSTRIQSNQDVSVLDLERTQGRSDYSQFSVVDSLRLRCRQSDISSSTRSFRLEAGFYVNAGITLSKVTEAGSDAVYTVHECFFSGKNSETAVPPATLFFQ